MDKYKPVPCPECGLEIQLGELQCPHCFGYDAPQNPTIDPADLFDDDNDDEEIQEEAYSKEIQTQLYG